MDDSSSKMVALSEQTCVEIDEKRIPIDIILGGNEVPCKLVPDEKGLAATWVAPGELPPEYCECDPLECDSEPARPPVFQFGSFSSTGSFWDEDDDVTEVAETGPIWSELDLCGRIRYVLLRCVGKFVALLLLLYIFICSLDFLSSAFRILGGKTAGGVFNNSEILGNPIAGLMIGILSTVLVQSSSTSTSVIVTMVASGIINVEPAIPMVMGANIGTSVTNTIVSMAQSSDRREFRRAFAGATVHDMFNWLTVIVLLPLEWATGYLCRFTGLIVSACKLESSEASKQELLKALTKPFTSLVVKVDKKVITKIAEGHDEYRNKSLIKKYCVFEEQEVLKNVTMETNVTLIVNGTPTSQLMNTTTLVTVTEKVPVEKCFSLFSHLEINETLAGVLLLIFSLAILCTCLVGMVKLLHSILQGSIAKVIKKTLNADFPGCFSWLTGYVAMLVGAVMTILVQSSSVFTSALTPLVGIGMIKLERMYPLTLGSNIGTTGTGLLAAMAASGDRLPIALQIALCHLFFNISGILLFYPIKPMRNLPIKCAKFLGTVTAEYRWFAIAYLILMFVLLPGSVFALSLAGFIPFICVASVVASVVTFVIILNLLQTKCKDRLPKKLQTWSFLPKCLRSLQPIDSVIMKVWGVLTKCCPCCRTCCIPKKKRTMTDVVRHTAIAAAVAGDDPTKRPSPSASAASSALLLPICDRVSVV
ncbi:sodium-dependent phosphate transport protein 2B-like [Mercenaria mercenaria]|uniref:sodium-dependent phosphate transport protein 2B-like n=1 Tax=Mercenaria mercenaria TaxID=6596 RepID=UPI00234E614A|nr:sodium-dependent phosphate transport protein 2B-like [Mercenaria mercenaria]